MAMAETDVHIQTLLDMGFPQALAQMSLCKSQGDIQRAVAICMSRPATQQQSVRAARRSEAAKGSSKRPAARGRGGQQQKVEGGQPRVKQPRRSDVVCSICIRSCTKKGGAQSGSRVLNCAGPCMRAFHEDCLAEDDEQPLPAAEDASAWLCTECSADEHRCFACNSHTSDDGAPAAQADSCAGRPVRCSEKDCGRHYHIECVSRLRHSRLTSATTFVCPSHRCHSCTRPVKDGDGSALFCVACPVAYHAACLPLGCRPIPGTSTRMHCQACRGSDDAGGGGGGDDDDVLPGDAVWCKHSKADSTWFPAKVCLPADIPDHVVAARHRPADVCVYFFGTAAYSWLGRANARLRAFGCHPEPPFKPPEVALEYLSEIDDTGGILNTESAEVGRKKKWREWAIGFQEMREWAEHRKVQALKEPPFFQTIRRNVYCCAPPRKSDDDIEDVCDCSPDTDDACSDDGCINRAAYVECNPKTCPAGKICCNQRLQRRQWTQGLEVNRTDGKGWGLFVKNGAAEGSLVAEFTGEVLDQTTARRRIQRYHDEKWPCLYMLSLAQQLVIDAAHKGSVARFVNHSCEPNAVLQRWQVLGQGRLGLFATRDLLDGEEVTVDYRLSRADDDGHVIPCLCGAPSCTGFIGAKGKEKQSSDCSDSEETSGLVWASLKGFPWWPARIRPEAVSGLTRKKKREVVHVHVEFFDEPPTVAWVAKSRIRDFLEAFDELKTSVATSNRLYQRFDRAVKAAWTDAHPDTKPSTASSGSRAGSSKSNRKSQARPLQKQKSEECESHARKPRAFMLQQLISMGYDEKEATTALMTTRSASLDAALDELGRASLSKGRAKRLRTKSVRSPDASSEPDRSGRTTRRSPRVASLCAAELGQQCDETTTVAIEYTSPPLSEPAQAQKPQLLTDSKQAMPHPEPVQAQQPQLASPPSQTQPPQTQPPQTQPPQTQQPQPEQPQPTLAHDYARTAASLELEAAMHERLKALGGYQSEEVAKCMDSCKSRFSRVHVVPSDESWCGDCACALPFQKPVSYDKLCAAVRNPEPRPQTNIQVHQRIGMTTHRDRPMQAPLTLESHSIVDNVRGAHADAAPVVVNLEEEQVVAEGTTQVAGETLSSSQQIDKQHSPVDTATAEDRANRKVVILQVIGSRIKAAMDAKRITRDQYKRVAKQVVRLAMTREENTGTQLSNTKLLMMTAEHIEQAATVDIYKYKAPEKKREHTHQRDDRHKKRRKAG